MKHLYQLTLLMALLSAPVVFAQKRTESLGHIVGGAGLLFNTFWGRIGRNNWEVGLISINGAGIAKLLPVGRYAYGLFGLGIGGNAMDAAAFGGAGFQTSPYGPMRVRFEFIGMMTAKNFGRGDLLLGIELFF